ncbi:uberolysin/carnocyclin family circular bacteriocin [Arthrobacter sp. NPDC080031]|uniref:uberolysin/carnocyclin family circular bacteriocin n=1 Tax=Arthrobacter sp. NPDC080031 TaxID=3155918 RepID=UPI00344F51C5
MEATIRPSIKSVTFATAVSLAGLALASASVMYIAGMFGLSHAFASQIVSAIEVGGIALAIVMGVLSGGIAAAVIATARWAILRWGKRAAIA